MTSSQHQTLAGEILALANEILLVKEISPNLFELSSNAESKWLLGKVSISFLGRARLDPETKTMKYCDRIKKVSSGWGGEDTGFTADSYIIDGLERSGSGMGFLPSGSSYSYDYGNMRNLMRALAEKHGWTFKVTWFLPK